MWYQALQIYVSVVLHRRGRVQAGTEGVAGAAVDGSSMRVRIILTFHILASWQMSKFLISVVSYHQR